MNKKKIITISIISVLAAILLLTIILFGFVFRLRHQKVVIVGDDELYEYVENEKTPLSKSKILSAAGLKNGKSTFLIDKAQAINNIEQAFPYVKVIQISTTGVSTIEIRLTCRYEMFSYKLEDNSNYYILDEDLKVLSITKQNPELPIINPISLKNNGETNVENILKISSKTKVGDFVGSKYYRNVISNLYTSIYRSALLEDETGNLNFAESSKTHYASREEIKQIITSVEFKTGNTLTETYTRIILTTNCGIKIDIGKPEEDLLNKVNLCFLTINQMDEENFLKQGTVQYGYDKNGQARPIYVTNNSAD